MHLLAQDAPPIPLRAAHCTFLSVGPPSCSNLSMLALGGRGYDGSRRYEGGLTGGPFGMPATRQAQEGFAIGGNWGDRVVPFTLLDYLLAN